MSKPGGWPTEMVLLEVSRVRRLLERYPAALGRLFSMKEQAYCEARRRNPYQHYAARLAAKMAARRLLGQGGLNDFEIGRDGLGAPHIHYSGKGKWLYGELVVSLSHEGDRAAALVGCVENDER